MTRDEANARRDEALALARVEREQRRCDGLIALIEADIEIQKETAIARPEIASECRGAVIALRRLLSVTAATTDDD